MNKACHKAYTTTYAHLSTGEINVLTLRAETLAACAWTALGSGSKGEYDKFILACAAHISAGKGLSHYAVVDIYNNLED